MALLRACDASQSLLCDYKLNFYNMLTCWLRRNMYIPCELCVRIWEYVRRDIYLLQDTLRDECATQTRPRTHMGILECLNLIPLRASCFLGDILASEPCVYIHQPKKLSVGVGKHLLENYIHKDSGLEIRKYKLHSISSYLNCRLKRTQLEQFAELLGNVHHEIRVHAKVGDILKAPYERRIGTKTIHTLARVVEMRDTAYKLECADAHIRDSFWYKKYITCNLYGEVTVPYGFGNLDLVFEKCKVVKPVQEAALKRRRIVTPRSTSAERADNEAAGLKSRRRRRRNCRMNSYLRIRRQRLENK